MKRLRGLLGRSEVRSLPATTGFAFLAEELIQEILKHLRWPTDFYVLSLVCRTLCRHATPELYATLVVSYHRPERISALLALLKHNPERASCVKTLLFDEDVKSIGPNLQSRGKWPPNAFRRELTDGWRSDSPHLQSLNEYPNNRCHVEIARRLRFVLPTLHNLRRVVMRSLHPKYMYPTSEGATIGAEENIWSYIFEGSPQITEVYVNGVLGGRLDNIILSRLTTVGISALFYRVDGHIDAAQLWNVTLTGAVNLKTLVMVDVELVPIVLDKLSFPSLEALELYLVCLGPYSHENDSKVFVDFLYRHSHTLRILAIACPMWGNIDHTIWLSDEHILPALDTLRIHHTMALLMTIDEITGSPGSSHGEIHAHKTRILTEFIRQRPTILDVGISSLKCPEADEFARYLEATRPMCNLLIGRKAQESLDARACRTDRFWGYGFEAWAFYELFGGLTITRSGHRPKLPHPHPLAMWKKLFT